MHLSRFFKPRKLNRVFTPEPKPGDVPLSRTKGQKVTVEEFRELRELIRYRYALDVEIWGLRDVKPYSRDVVGERMRKADAALAKIQRTVNNWDKREFFSSDADYEKFEEIKRRVLEPGKRNWTLHPPWEEREAGSREPGDEILLKLDDLRRGDQGSLSSLRKTSTSARNSLVEAALKGDCNLISTLLQAGEPVDSFDEHSAPVDPFNEQYDTPVDSFDEQYGTPVDSFDEQYGIPVDSFDEQYGAALFAAASNGQAAAVLLLCKHGADQKRAVEFEKALETLDDNITFDNLGEVFQYFEEARATNLLRQIKCKSQLLSLFKFSGINHGEPICLEEEVVLIGKNVRSGLRPYPPRVEAATCAEVIRRRWGDNGLSLLRDISTRLSMALLSPKKPSSSSAIDRESRSRHLISLPTTGVDQFNVAPLECDCISSILLVNDIITVDFRPTASGDDVKLVAAILDLINKAFGVSPSEGFTLSSSSYRIRLEADIRGHGEWTAWFALEIISQTEPLSALPDDCWKPLFETGVVVDSGVSESSVTHTGKGLEVSFDLMVALAAVKFPIAANGSIMFVGYQTVLVLTKFEDNIAQFHLEMSEKKGINPYLLETSQGTTVDNCQKLRTATCFIGWCEVAHINLGTTGMDFSIGYSGATEKEGTLHFDGITTAFQAVTAAPLQAGFNVQAQFRFTSNRVRFTPSGGFSLMIWNTSTELTILYDALDRRAWLVPKLSLMLHMCHAWIASRKFPLDPIPFVQPHHDISNVAQALEGTGDISICGLMGDARFYDLLLGIRTNLLNLKGTEDSRNFYGFEFMDVITEPGRGSCMKKIKIQKKGRTWLDITDYVDAVVVCSGVGDVVTPSNLLGRESDRCNSLPKGLDYLAAPMSCLVELIKRFGRPEKQLAPILPDPCIPISKALWTVIGNPFDTCTHTNHSKTCCWDEKKILQRLTRHDNILRFIEQKKQVFPVTLSLNGVVVFGQNDC